MATVLTRTEVIQTYRYLLRSMQIAFQGDTTTLQAARKEARSRFNEKRSLNADSPETLEAITEARNVGKFLRENLVQGIKDEGTDAYKLRIHDEVERGDNASIKNPPPLPMPARKTRRRKTDLS